MYVTGKEEGISLSFHDLKGRRKERKKSFTWNLVLAAPLEQLR